MNDTSEGYPFPVADPDAPTLRETLGRWLGALVVALGIAAWIVAAKLPSSHDLRSDPEAVVTAYLAALTDGNAAQALSYGPTPPNKTYLTNAALEQQNSARTGYASVYKVHVDGNHAVATVDANLGPDNYASYHLTRKHGRWQLDATWADIPKSQFPNLAGLTLFGTPVAGDETIAVFPGALVWAGGADSADVTVNFDDTYGSYAPAPGAQAVVPAMKLGLTSHGGAKVDAALRTHITACAAKKSPAPTGCENNVSELGYYFGDDVSNVVASSVQWSVPEVAYQINPVVVTSKGIAVVSVWVQYGVRFVANTDHGRVVVNDLSRDFATNGTVDLNAATPTFTPTRTG